MYPTQFAEHLAVWLSDAQHPGVVQVRTCADIGRWEQPVGVAVTLSDGWLWVLQCLGGSPAGGDVKRSPSSVRPDLPEGSWEDMPVYQQARRAFDAEQAAYSGPKTRLPQASVASLFALAAEVVRRHEHLGIASVETPDRPVLLIGFADGAAVYGRHAGFMAPGSTELEQTT
jgi:hypothetical protein